MDIVGKNWVRDNLEMVALKHFIDVKISLIKIKIIIVKSLAFEKVKNRLTDALLVIVSDINYSFFSLTKTLEKATSPDPRKASI